MTTRHRHVRIDDTTWATAQHRATHEGTTISAVVREFVVAYAAGRVGGRWRREDRPVSCVGVSRRTEGPMNGNRAPEELIQVWRAAWLGITVEELREREPDWFQAHTWPVD